MKKRSFPIALAALALFSLCANRDCAGSSVKLPEIWKFKTVEKFGEDYRAPGHGDFDWGKVTVPGQWQRIPGLDRYHGRAVYRLVHDFGRPAPDLRYHLEFEGVFYKARVWLNGVELGSHEGYFEPFSFEVTDLIREGENALAVEVECLREKEVTRKRQVLGVFGNWDVISSYRNPGGIWLPVRYRITGPAWIERIKLSTLAVDPVRARAQAEFGGNLPEDATLTLLFEPDNFEGDTLSVRLPVTGPVLDGEVDLPAGRVWHPYKRGAPHCYRVTATLKQGEEALDATEFLTGFRVARVEDGFRFFVNGEPLYVKGNNYAPSLVYLSETTRELVEKDVEMMKAAHYDMVRVHAHVDHPEFYNACDRGGLLVWQDAPFQWGYHPDILEEAVRQSRAMVNLLYNHPSIVVWTAHNEPLAAGLDRTRPNPVDLFRSARPLLSMLGSGEHSDWNYDVMDAALLAAIEEEDPYRPANRASGRVGVGHDWHQYFGWYQGEVDDLAGWMEKEIADNPANMRFVTEFGAQAFPEHESAVKFMPDDIAKLTVNRRRLHLENMWQPGIMRFHLNYMKFDDLEEFIEATQDYQARLLKYHVERVRMTKRRPNHGVLAFLHNDSQPAITWSVVDVWRVPKNGYFALQEAFQDALPMMPFRFAPYREGETVSFPVHVVNDTLDERSGCEVRVMLPDGREESFSVSLAPDMEARPVGSFDWTAPGQGVHEVELTLSCPGMDNVRNRYELIVE